MHIDGMTPATLVCQALVTCLNAEGLSPAIWEQEAVLAQHQQCHLTVESGLLTHNDLSVQCSCPHCRLWSAITTENLGPVLYVVKPLTSVGGERSDAWREQL